MNMRPGNQQTTTIETEIPNTLLVDARVLVDQGWYQDMDELLLDALRHFLEARNIELTEQQVRDDVAWGLEGRD
jgi:Arc/MetJ-type ribon-helix-helix transcriptional regulator